MPRTENHANFIGLSGRSSCVKNISIWPLATNHFSSISIIFPKAARAVHNAEPNDPPLPLDVVHQMLILLQTLSALYSIRI